MTLWDPVALGSYCRSGLLGNAAMGMSENAISAMRLGNAMGQCDGHGGVVGIRLRQDVGKTRRHSQQPGGHARPQAPVCGFGIPDDDEDSSAPDCGFGFVSDDDEDEDEELVEDEDPRNWLMMSSIEFSAISIFSICSFFVFFDDFKSDV